MWTTETTLDVKRAHSVFFFSTLFSTSLSFAGNSGHLTQVRHSGCKSSTTHSFQCVEYFPVSRQWYGCQHYPLLSVCGVFSCVQTMVWLPVFGFFNRGSDVDACNCTQGLYGLLKSALEVDSGRKISCLQPLSALHLAFQSDAPPAELFPTSVISCGEI